MCVKSTQVLSTGLHNEMAWLEVSCYNSVKGFSRVWKNKNGKEQIALQELEGMDTLCTRLNC